MNSHIDASYYGDYLRNKEGGHLASNGKKCVNCGNWIEPPAVAFFISDSQRYPTCVCGNPCSQQQAFLDGIFGKVPKLPSLPPGWPSVPPRVCQGPPLYALNPTTGAISCQ